MGGEVFEKDAEGMIVTRPLTGWNIAPIAGVAILCQLKYVMSEEELRAGTEHNIQLVLTPLQANELAGMLARQGSRLLEVNPSESVN